MMHVDAVSGAQSLDESTLEVELGHLARDLLNDADSSPDPQFALSSVLQRARQITRSEGLLVLQRSHQGRWMIGEGHATPSHVMQWQSVMSGACRLATLATESHQLELARVGDGQTLTLAALPLSGRAKRQSVLIAILPSALTGVPLKRRILLLELLAAFISRVLRGGPAGGTESSVDRVLTQFLLEAPPGRFPRQAIQHAMDRLPRYLGCGQLFLARGRRNLRLEFVSGRPRFDQHSELSRLVLSVMEQARLRQADPHSGNWLDVESIRASSALKHATGHQHLWLIQHTSEASGISTLLLAAGRHPAPPPGSEPQQSAERAVGLLASLFDHFLRGFATRPRQLLMAWKRIDRVTRRMLVGAVALLLAGLLAVPMAYPVKGHCVLQPVQRRYVAVPYEGRLEASFVGPGDVVAKGQLIARMDNRELELEISRLQTDYKGAEKRRDAAMSERDTSLAQMARLDMERLALQIQLIEQQSENLEIKSPIRGIVVSGDPQKIEGSRVHMGQSIVEIAPLRDMVVEVDIPDRDIQQVHEGDRVAIRFDASPETLYEGALHRIYPRAEQRGGKNVFVGNVELSNPDGELKPGMQGTARISGRRHSLAWNLFHRGWENLRFGLLW